MIVVVMINFEFTILIVCTLYLDKNEICLNQFF